ncbi:uncharacterized protein [Apostichopus japonicus]|uniref:uncharacterized protein n=1 Tax=Stichopus japonicus TaxID=307972 RepID=UPI003AB310F1
MSVSKHRRCTVLNEKADAFKFANDLTLHLYVIQSTAEVYSTLIKAMERALEVFQPFLFLKMDVNITGAGHNELNSNKDLPTEYIELIICCLELNNGSSSLVEAIPKKMEIYFAPWKLFDWLKEA